MPRASVISHHLRQHRFFYLCVIQIPDAMMNMIKMLGNKDEQIRNLRRNVITSEARAAVVAMTMGVQINNLKEELAHALSRVETEKSHEEVRFV